MAIVLVKSLLFPDHSNVHARLPTNSHNLEKASFKEDFNDADTSSRASCSPTKINPRIISDATIGLADGLTVPFALTAGLSALGDTRVVIYGGLAELIAGGISMGLGGYLGAKSEAEAYRAALVETQHIVDHDHLKASSMVRAAFADYTLDHNALETIAQNLLLLPDQMIDFLMRFHHQLAEADFAPSRAYVSGVTISAGYFFGGFVPLLPYLFVDDVQAGFSCSVAVMVIALFCFGWVKTALLGERSRKMCFRSGIQMVLLGGVAAFAAVACVRLVER